MIRITRKQRQEGGTGAQQIQVAGNLVQVIGVTEQRAVEIAKEQSKIAIQEFTADAAAEAGARMDKLDEKIVDDLSSRGLLEVLADPAFQILLRKAQLQAASTPEETDYELLAKLLSERAGEPSKGIHLVISRAVEIIEYLDSAALTGMMFLWFIVFTHSNIPDPKTSLSSVDVLFSKFLAAGQPPEGAGWMQRLELMDCVHYQPPGGFQTVLNKWPEVYLQATPGYMCEGIAPEDVDSIRTRLSQVIPHLDSMVVEHSFFPSRFRINAISSAQVLRDLETSLQAMSALKEQQSEQALKDLYGFSTLENLGNKEELEQVLIAAKLDIVSVIAKDRLLEFVQSELPNLQKLRAWWDSLSGISNITPVGIAIGFSNAKRFDPLDGLPTLPDIIGFS